MARIDIKSVKIRNFLSYGNKTQEVLLKSGLNALVGHIPGNETSNGAGKTALMESISFALYGRLLKYLRQDQIVNWQNKKNCVVEIKFSRGNNDYVIIRGLKPNFMEVYENGSLLPFSGKIDIQNTLEEDILGIRYNTFINLSYTNLNTSIPLLKMNRQKKRIFAEKLFDLELYSQLNLKCVSKLNNIEHRKNKIQAEMKLNSTLIEEYQKQLDELQLSDIVELRKHLDELVIEKDNIIFVDVSVYDDNLRDLRHKREVLYRYLNQVEIKYGIYNEKIKNLRVVLQQQKNRETEIEKLTEQRQINENELKKRQTTSLNTRLNTIDKQISKFNKELNVLQQNLFASLQHIQYKENDLQIIQKKSSCPMCMRTIKGDSVALKVEAKLKFHKNEYDILFEKIGDVQKKLSVEEKDKVNVLEEIEKNITIKNNIALIDVELDRLKSLTVDVNHIIERYEKVVKCYVSIIDKYTIDIDTLKINEKNIEEDKKQNDIRHNRAREILREIDIIETKVLQYESANVEGKLIEISNKISVLSAATETYKKEEYRLIHLADYIEFLKNTCKDEKIKQYAISSNIPFLNRTLNSYLNSAGCGFYVEMDKWMDCMVRGPGIYRGSYNNLSGGESRLVDMSLLLAFNDLSMIVSPNYFNVLILDELLDSSVDSFTVTKLFDIIRYKQKKDALAVFVVTHRTELSDMEFDNLYCTTKSQGFSTIREENGKNL